MRGLSIAMDNQILKLAELGYNIRGIAKCLNIARNTVRSRLRKNAEKSPTQKGRWWDYANWDTILKERAKGVTLKQIYAEHGEELTTYSTFCRYIGRNFKKPASPTIPPQHVAGERVQIDYCDGLKVVDRKSGKLTKTHLFCSVLPFSGYTFAEFVLNQKLESFISSHQRMWVFFGGTTPYVVIDNLKSGVTKAHLYDPDINKTYCDYSNHDGFAVMPARPINQEIRQT
ncbi:MAG: hypothetical protein AB8G05_17660 [Oligoflexales bacterium]